MFHFMKSVWLNRCLHLLEILRAIAIIVDVHAAYAVESIFWSHFMLIALRVCCVVVLLFFVFVVCARFGFKHFQLNVAIQTPQRRMKFKRCSKYFNKNKRCVCIKSILVLTHLHICFWPSSLFCLNVYCLINKRQTKRPTIWTQTTHF